MSYRPQRIRDPIHNLILFEGDHFEDAIWRVIQTRPFQRLRRIKQLGFSDHVYPGATHSRFAHSIGVFHTARRLMAIIERSVGQANWDQTKAFAALAASLVHDVGHGAFSHAFEEVGKRLNLDLAKHELVSDKLIRDSEISAPLAALGSGFANDVADVIKSAGPRSVYDAVVSSQFDADRLDYMRRDRFMAGSSHGVIDYEWLVSNLQVDSVNTGVDEKQLGKIQTFVIEKKGILAAEAYVLGLFQLYPAIYLHKTTRGIEKLFTELMVRLFQLVQDDSISNTGLSDGHPLVEFAKSPSEIERAVKLDDTVIYGALSQLCDAKDKQICEIAERVRDRKTYKCFDLREYISKKLLVRGGDGNEFDRRLAMKVVSSIEKIELWKKGEKNDMVLLDQTKRPPYKRFDESKGPLNQIMVRNSDGKLSDLAEYSPVVAAMPTFEVARYYFDRDGNAETHLKKIVDEEMKNGR